MKRYLAFSDSHGNNSLMLKVIKKEKKNGVDGIFHMGDIEGGDRELRNSIPGPVHIVRGNCDYDRSLPEIIVHEIEGVTVVLTHGHRHQVHIDLSILRTIAEANDAKLVMFGHTHRPYLESFQGLTVLNPGSISKPRQQNPQKTYAIVTFNDDKTVEVEMRVGK